MEAKRKHDKADEMEAQVARGRRVGIRLSASAGIPVCHQKRHKL